MTEIMTLNEFKQAIAEWGNNWGIETQVVVEDDWTFVHANRIGRSSCVVATISNKDVCILNFVALETVNLGETERQTLFEIVTKFANTKPADRKDKEKKFYLKHRFIKSLTKQTYLTGDLNYFWLSVDDKSVDQKQQFTLEEIEEIKNKLGTNLRDFELIEVKEKKIDGRIKTHGQIKI